MTTNKARSASDILIEQTLKPERKERHAVRSEFAADVARSLSSSRRPRPQRARAMLAFVLASLFGTSVAVAAIARLFPGERKVESFYCADCAVEVQYMAPAPIAPVKAAKAPAPTRAAQVATAQSSVATPASVLTAVRELKIDGATEDLVRVTWVRVAPDGRIAFSQFDDRLVRFYDATGKLIGKFGRAGDGPGEFRSPSRAGWFGDSLWVHDAMAARLTIIPPSLGAPRIVQTGIRAFMRGTNPALPLITAGRIEGINRSGEILFSGLFFTDSIVRTLPTFADSLERAFVRAPSSAGYQNFLGGIPRRPDTRIMLGQESINQPFPTRSVTEGMHDASRFVMVVPSVDGADAGTFLVTSIGLRGDTIFSRRYPFRLDRIPAAEAQKAIDAHVATLQKLGNTNAESIRARVRIPPAYTPFGLVVMGRDGSTWISERITSPTRPWLVLDPRGNVFGRVILGERATVHEADLNNIWTVELDADDLPSVVRYRISRGG